jgi:GT2 family glycosyltransferase
VKTHYPDVRLLELKKNTGFARGVNIGIREAKGDFILVLNNDIVLDENALYEMVKVAVSASFVKDIKWAAIAPKMKFFNNPAFINAVGNSLYPISWGSDNFIGYVDFGQFDHVKESLSACFGAVMLNREALKHIGLLDRRYTFYYEDMDWSIRAHIYGYQIITAPKADVYHKFGASMSLKSQTFKTRFIVGNRLYFALKNLGRRTVRRFLFNYLLEDIKSILIYFKRKNLAMVFAYFRGYLRFFLSLPVLFFRRRRIQKQRKITGINDGAILARAAPLNLTLMEHGVPKLDIFSLRTNYAFLSSSHQSITPGKDLIIWRLRTPKKDEKSEEKIYMEFTFFLEEPGHYDIHLLGLIKRNLTIFLDNRPIKQPANADKRSRKTKRFEMNLLAAQNIFISEGHHLLELGWRSHVHAVLLKKL